MGTEKNDKKELEIIYAISLAFMFTYVASFTIVLYFVMYLWIIL